MSNKQKHSIIIMIMLVGIIAIIGAIVVATAINGKGNWITENEELYAKAISYIEKQRKEEGEDNKEQDYQVFIDYKGFGMEKKENKKYVYLWILEETYFVKNDRLRLSQGSSMPYKFTFENDEVIDYEIPLEGSYYASSIRNMFPNSIENEVLMYNMDDSRLKTRVKEHYSYLNSTEIIHVDPREEIIVFTGYYGGYTTKAEANSIKGKCIDGYGDIYEYEIPCNEEEEMLINVSEIDKEIVEKFKGNRISTLSEQDLTILLDNRNMILDEYKNVKIKSEDLPYSFAYAIINGNQKELYRYDNNTSEENISEGAKNLLNVIVKNNILYLQD